MNFKRAVLALGCVLSGAFAVPAVTLAANPAGIAFNNSLTNVPLYGKTTGLLITGRCNRYAAAFQTARAKGAEVLAYLNPTERPNVQPCALDKQFYMNNYAAVPLWPYPKVGQRAIWSGHKMTDMRPGSAWILHVVKYVENLMRENKVDGVFLDVVGGRPWGTLAGWNNWPQSEKNAWTDGSIDLVKRLQASRNRIRPNFIIMNNNVWDRGDTRGLAGEKYVDGVTIEHPAGVTAWHANYAKKAFGDGRHRRVLVIARNKSEALAWNAKPGVTHVSDQMYYGYPTVPPLPFKALKDR
jgi:hypothetical protein